MTHARLLGIAGALVGAGFVVPLALSTTGRTSAAPTTSASCRAARVHYERFPYASPAVKKLPWVLAEPISLKLAGHLFYYDAHNPWAAHHRPDWRIYTGGKSPDKRVNMKVLWTAAPPVSDAPSLSVRGVRTGRPGSFAQVLAVGPSILKIPRPGCWRLTLKAGGTTSHLTVLAIRS